MTQPDSPADSRDVAPADVRSITRRVSVAHRPSGAPIIRLMSPGDLGRVLKPFVFLDLFSADARVIDGFSLHPHSGIATVTIVTDGELRFTLPHLNGARLDYGGVEWMRAAGGVWHGKELASGASKRVTGFQLWIALPPDLENGAVDEQYLPAHAIPRAGPARIILGEYAGERSPVRAPEGVNYLLVTLQPGESWTYAPPADHAVLWAAVAAGRLAGETPLSAGELGVFDTGSAPVRFEADAQAAATFVVGSAPPFGHELFLGYHSVHTSEAALARGEARIAQLRPR